MKAVDRCLVCRVCCGLAWGPRHERNEGLEEEEDGGRLSQQNRQTTSVYPLRLWQVWRARMEKEQKEIKDHSYADLVRTHDQKRRPTPEDRQI